MVENLNTPTVDNTGGGVEVAKNGNEIVRMTISAKNSNFLMKSLSKLYSEPLEALIREYTSNAHDSHKKAGQTTKPVELTITSEYYRGPILHITIKDYGTGMSKEEIRNILSVYGESSKRDTNEELGRYGLGAKVGFALVNKFTIISTKDGYTTVAEARMGEYEDAYIEFISHDKTDEPNGTEIVLKNISAKSEHISSLLPEKFFAAWNTNTIEVNGKNPYSVHDDTRMLPLYGFKKTIVGFYREKQNYKHLDEYNPLVFLVNGPVTYSMPVTDFKKKISLTRLEEKLFEGAFIEIPIGTVDIAPPREGLMWTEKTIETLKLCVKNFISVLSNTLTQKINKLSLEDKTHYILKNNAAFKVMDSENNIENKDKNDYVNKPIIFDDVNWNPKIEGKTYYVVPKNKGEYEDVTLLSLFSMHSDLTLFNVETPNNILKSSWLTTNRNDYCLQQNLNVEQTMFVQFEKPNTNPIIESLITKISKETFINQAKLWRKNNTVEIVKPEQTYTLLTISSTMYLEITPTLVQDIDVETTIFVSFDSREIIGAEQEKYNKEPTKNHAITAYTGTFFTAVQYLNPKITHILVLGKKSSTILKKHLPELKSFTSMVEEYWSSLNEFQKNSILYVSQMAAINNIQQFRGLVSLAHIFKENNLQTTNNQINEMFKFWSEDDISTKAFNTKIFTAILVRFFIPNYKTLIQNDNLSLFKVAPMMFSSSFSKQHMVQYLNNVSFDEPTKSKDMVDAATHNRIPTKISYTGHNYFMDALMTIPKNKENFILYS